MQLQLQQIPTCKNCPAAGSLVIIAPESGEMHATTRAHSCKRHGFVVLKAEQLTEDGVKQMALDSAKPAEPPPLPPAEEVAPEGDKH